MVLITDDFCLISIKLILYIIILITHHFVLYFIFLKILTGSFIMEINKTHKKKLQR